MSETIGSRFEARKGFGAGFDAIRVFLALGILVWHEFSVLPHRAWLDGMSGVWFLGYAMLFIFFALSGILITGSAQRLSLPNFLINRGLRIIPALLVEVVLSAFVLGVIFTSLSTRAYFTNPQTFHYLTNIVGLMNFQLPGVFESNGTDAVNYSLWTVPYEMVCYAIMSALIIFGLLRWPKLIVAGALIVCMIGFSVLSAGYRPVQASHLFLEKVCYFFFTHRGSRLFVAFLLGIAVYLWRFRIPYNKIIVLACLIICIGVALVGPADWMTFPTLNVIVSVPLIYITAYVGVSDVPLLPVFHRGDYSYGIYLYAMPIQQAVAATFPNMRSIPLHLAITLPIVVLFAIFSWHCIEKPILHLRRRFSFVARIRDVGDEGSTNQLCAAIPGDEIAGVR